MYSRKINDPPDSEINVSFQQRSETTSELPEQQLRSRVSGRGGEAQRSRSPEAVVQDPVLTREEKLGVLKQWAYDERLIAVAVQEGMPGPEPVLLRRILNALSAAEGLQE